MTAVLAVGGLVLLALAVLLRARRKARVRRVVADWLESRDPGSRIAAVNVITQHGLREHLPLLVDLIDSETHPAVRAALADAIRRQRWEANDDVRILRLRMWAERVPVRSPS
jgi:hypothetical protein